jgi:hypothetical protein
MRWAGLVKKLKRHLAPWGFENNGTGSVYSEPGLNPISARGRGELLLHEYAHCLLLGLPRAGNSSNRIDAACRAMSPDAADRNEFQSIAVSLLVARAFGLCMGERTLAGFALLGVRQNYSVHSAQLQIRRYLSWAKVQKTAAKIVNEVRQA